MAKRWCENEIWKKQRWFRKLSPINKLCFFYIKDQCDHAGIWSIDCSDLIEDTGINDFDLKDFVSSINTEYDKITGAKIEKERLIVLDNSLLWITGFIQFQYEGKDKIVQPGANAVKSALMIIDSIKFNPSEPFHNPSRTLNEPLTVLEYALSKFHIKSNQPLAVLRQGFLTLKDKDKDKDKLVKLNAKKNGKFSGNFKAQGEELLAQRIEKRNERFKGTGTDGD